MLPKQICQKLARSGSWTSSRPRSGPTSRELSTVVNDATKHIAVIGAGISGLSAAHRLAQDQSVQVTIYEKSPSPGGWLQSEIVEVDGGQVLFEFGPRTLRAAMAGSYSILELLFDLGLKDQIIQTSSHSAAARNRYIYYPDHLVRLPAPQPGASTLMNGLVNIMNMFKEPLLRDVPWAVLLEAFRPRRNPQDSDESVADFVSRRASRSVADNLVSAVFHGIFAGDIYQLSAQTLLSPFWEYELSDRRVLGELVDRLSKGERFVPYDVRLAVTSSGVERGPEYVENLRSFVRGSNVLTLKKGMRQIVDQLETSLVGAGNVEIKTGAEITHISKVENSSDLTVKLGDGSSQNYSYIISTTSSKALAQQLHGPTGKPSPTATSRVLMSNNYAVTVMVVNLYYKSTNLVPLEGFGYLIPRSIPFIQNPECALGVIFASQSSVGQDSAGGTKLTVMLGGHWWDGWAEHDFPDEQSAIDMAKAVLERHMQITEQPVVARARLQRDAIPQYTVGHVSRMESLHGALLRQFNSRLKVAGAWYTGIAVNDCVRSGRLLASSVLSGSKTTGLEKYQYPNRLGHHIARE